jgi:hypothetical protein
MPILGVFIERAFSLRNRLQRNWLSPIKYQEDTLRRLLQKASDTAFGRRYQFKKMLSGPDMLRAFQQAVPIHDYDAMHDQWWQRALQNEENVCWPGKIKYFALSSGTSGAPSKYIPVTDAIRRTIRRASLRMLFNVANFTADRKVFTSNMLMLSGSTTLVDKGEYFVGDLSGINVGKQPFFLRKIYKPEPEISKIDNWGERIAAIVENAPNWNIGFITGIPAWNQLMLEKIIQHYKLKTIHDIWPNLSVFVHGGVAFEPYRKGFEKLVARPLVYIDTYLASEGFIAFQNRSDTRSMSLILDNGIFLEFVPFNSDNFDESGNIKGNPRAFTVEEVEEGEEYALVISTCAGAWRYLIGDTLRFTDKQRMEIIITGRTKHFLSICGEHLSVDNMNQAMQSVEHELDIVLREFTVCGVESSDGTYFTHKWYIGCDMPVDVTVLQEKLDNALKKVNDDYKTERSAVLGIQVEVLPSEVFYKWQESMGKMGGQNKFPRVMKKEDFDKWENFVKELEYNI